MPVCIEHTGVVNSVGTFSQRGDAKLNTEEQGYSQTIGYPITSHIAAM